jgi:hypothetical protein
MKRVVVAVAAVVALGLVSQGFAQPMYGWGGQGMGPGMMYGWGGGPGAMGGWGGRGMMGGGPGGGAWTCPGWSGANVATAPEPITEEKAKELAQQYADQYLKGFTVERVLPFTGWRGTMYSVELKGPEGQVRTFHINPWGNVMPFGGPARRG